MDVDKIKEYFPTEHVLSEMMQIYQEIFGFVFRKYVVFVFLPQN